MRKLMLLACAAGCCLLLAAPGQAQNDETQALIDKAIKAAGGAEKLAALKATQMKFKGTVSIQGMDAEVSGEIFNQEPDKLKLGGELTINNMNIAVVQVINGDKGWVNVAGNTADLDADTIKEAKEKLNEDRLTNLLPLKGKEYKVSSLGEVKVGQHQTIGIQVTRQGYKDVSLYFDKTTHLLIKSERRGLNQEKQEVNQETFFSEHKELVPGLKLPAKVLVHQDGKKFLELSVTEMRTSDKFDDSIFAKP